MTMNVLWRTNDSRENFIPSILEELHNKELIDKCVVVSQGSDRYDESFCYEIPASYGYGCNYKKLCNENLLPPPQCEILEELRIYKETAFNMMCRRFNEHLMYYDEMNEEYMRHVTYWNWILDEHNIDFVFFMVMPHTPWEYIIYSLAKVKNVHTLIISGANILGFQLIGTTISNLGRNSHVMYEKYKDKNLSMNPIVEESYLAIKNRIPSPALNINLQIVNNEIKDWIKNNFYINASLRLKDYLKLVKNAVDGSFNDGYMCFKKKKDFSSRFKRVRKTYRSLAYYNSISCNEPVFDDKYIIYYLHYEPENATLPMGGIFVDQIYTIKLLAKVCKSKNIKLYVKEHPTQFCRKKKFYDELKKIPNVVLMNSSVDYYMLMDSAIATATICGTCSFESIIRGTPSIRFKTYDLENIPGVFGCDNSDDITNAIDLICSKDYFFDKWEVEQYFRTYHKSHIAGYLDWKEIDRYDIDIMKAKKQTIDLITKYIASGLLDNFCYEVD